MRLILGDCVARMAELDAESIDAAACDPPYGLEFMGKDWDRPWAVSPAQSVGYAGRDDLTLPAHRDGRNANCRTCGGRARGKNRCRCETPNWDRHPREDMVAFQRWTEEWAAEALRVLRPGGYLLAFSGTTGIAAELEGFDFVGVERDAEYLAIAEARIRFWAEHGEETLRRVAERDSAERDRRDLADAGQLDLFATEGEA